MMKQMLGNSYLFGANAPFIEELYESYLANPASVEPAWRDYFDKLQNLPGAGNYSGPDVAHARSSPPSPSAPSSAPCRRRPPPRRQASRSRCCS
jgi:2-oxoglutarate dehydrogenase complex dehydrogenase (E1) component-like enzyme